MSERFLYHARPADMWGETLYPLNALRDLRPELYGRADRKYEGREALRELRIPLLDVLWTDVVHLAPLHPYRLAEAWLALGLRSPAWELQFFRIPVERIAGRPAVWFASGVLSGEGSLPAEAVSPFDSARYRELDEAPARYRDYLRERPQGGRPPRPFAHVPHVLVTGWVDVTDVALVRADVPPG